MLREIVDLGFDRVELGHGIRISLMPGIQKMYEDGKVRFSSLHNFCPLPVEVLGASPDCYQFSSAYGKERDRAVKQTFQTIDFAERLGAPFIVMHLGEIRMKPVTGSLIKLARKGELLSRKYVREKIRAVEKREAASAAHLDRVKDCLRRIVEYAVSKKVKLGIEGRRGYEEIPSERELPALLDELNSPQVGYWHDFGHIQIKENLALLDHAEWLRQIGPRTFGCHVQDCIWPAQDHQPPFTGDVDLAQLVPLLPKDCAWVWEMSPRKTTDVIVEIAAAIRWQILLRVQKIRLNVPRLIGLFLIGMFYNQFLPGGTGGDIIKSYLLLKETPDHKAGALLAVVFDRLIGLVALVTITVTLVTLRFDLLWRTPVTVESGFTPHQLLVALGILLGVSISGLVASFIISGFNLFHLLPHKFPGKDKLIEIAAAYHLYARHWIATFFAFGASLVAHVATFATFLFVAYALHAEDVRKSPPAPVPAIDFFAVMPIERTLTAVPISLAGIGLREKLLQVMLNNICGVTIEKAKLIGSLGFLVILVCCAPGGIVYFFYKPSGIAKRVGIREMQREVATMEHEIQEPQ